jgi:hypothetical protein
MDGETRPFCYRTTQIVASFLKPTYSNTFRRFQRMSSYALSIHPIDKDIGSTQLLIQVFSDSSIKET